MKDVWKDLSEILTLNDPPANGLIPCRELAIAIEYGRLLSFRSPITPSPPLENFGAM
jgi:hypothetical protein